MSWKRFLSVFLVLSLAFSTSYQTSFAQSQNSRENTAEADDNLDLGNLDVLLLLNYPVRLKEKDICFSLFKDGELFLEKSFLGTKKALTLKGTDGNLYPVQMELGDREGNPVSLDGALSLAQLSFQQLPAGVYYIQLEGEGFKTFTSKELRLDDFSKRIIIANSNDTFTAGDLNQDDAVTEKDLGLLKELLDTPGSKDLNRDGVWDIVDYTYLYNNLNAGGAELVENTAAIPGSFLAANEADPKVLKLCSPTAKETMEFSNQDQIVSEGHPVEIEIPFQKAMELQYVKLYVPDLPSGISKGTLEYETAGGTTERTAFDSKTGQLLQTAALLTEDKEPRAITINLGKRVAIKKITITVTGTQQDATLASIAKVEFLQNLIPTIQDEANQVKNVTAKPGDKSVTLTWNGIANVTKYKIRYGASPQTYTDELYVSSLTATIQGLSNDTPYYFIVCGVNGDWVGIPSLEVSCTPKEMSAPGRVGGVKVEEGDTSLILTWGAEKSAASYNLFYKEEEGTKEYQKITGIKENTYTLNGLTNDTSYILCVSAQNEFGEGAKSPEVRGTPTHMEITKPENLPTKNKLPSSAVVSIALSHKDHYDKEMYPNGIDPNAVIDGDYSTHWTARGNWWENQGFVVTFDRAYEMNHLAWTTRLDQEKYKTSINRYYIEVWGEDDDLSKPGKVLVSYGTYIPSDQNTKTGAKILTFEKSKVKQIKVSTKMSDGGAANPSASELIFYTYYSLVDEISALFGNDLHTKLKNGVTLDTITALERQVNGETGEFYIDKALLLQELEVAKSLLTDTPIQNIISVETGRNASSDSSRGFAMKLNDMQPLGITAKTGETLLLYAEGGDAEDMPSLILSQYAGEAGKWNTRISLKPGRNAIMVPKMTDGTGEQGGSVYIAYHGSKSIRINVINGKKIPMLNLPEFTFETAPDVAKTKEAIRTYLTFLASYKPTVPKKQTLQTAVENTTEIATKHVLLSIPSESVANVVKQYAKTEDQVNALYETLLAWEKNMELHYTVCGLSKEASEPKNQLPTSRINIRYMTLTGKAFMYAGGEHIGIGYGSCEGTVKGKLPENGSSGLFGWGLNHEIGHVLDQTGLVYPETTNNIHSLFSQTYDGDKNVGVSRLEGGIYDSVYQKVSLSIPGKANNVFVQLAMYWQLHLAYDDDAKPYDFYHSLYQMLREKRETPEYKALSQDMLFVRLACDTVSKDLTDFFRHWGIALDSATIQYLKEKGYPKETRAIYYLNDEARRYRMNQNGAGFTGSEKFTVSVSQTDDSSGSSPAVQLSITAPASADGAVLGYEIKRNGETIAFTDSPSYLDTSVTLKNAELSYTITAYDYLLNTCSADAAPFRLVYDGVLDHSGFTYSIKDSAASIRMGSKQEVVGIKIKNHAITTPTVSGAAITSGMDVPVSLSYGGSADAGKSSIYYFNPPKASGPDARIWTYGMEEFSISLDVLGLQNLTEEELKAALFLLQYPGDSISFYSPKEQNTVGILNEDYIYGPSAEDRIKKGTVVVIGTYRGDPIYNAIKLYGTYSALPEEGSDEEAAAGEPVLLPGEQLLLAEVPEDKVMTNISNGFWIYTLNVSDAEPLPDTIRAELYRVDNPDTLEGERKVSDTISIPVPTYETLPLLTLTDTLLTMEDAK